MNTVASANAAMVAAGSNRRKKVSVDPEAGGPPNGMERPCAGWGGEDRRATARGATTGR